MAYIDENGVPRTDTDVLVNALNIISNNLEMCEQLGFNAMLYSATIREAATRIEEQQLSIKCLEVEKMDVLQEYVQARVETLENGE